MLKAFWGMKIGEGKGKLSGESFPFPSPKPSLSPSKTFDLIESLLPAFPHAHDCGGETDGMKKGGERTGQFWGSFSALRIERRADRAPAATRHEFCRRACLRHFQRKSAPNRTGRPCSNENAVAIVTAFLCIFPAADVARTGFRGKGRCRPFGPQAPSPAIHVPRGPLCSTKKRPRTRTCRSA